MPHFDRGVYEPTDDIRVFDGSEDDEDVEGSRLPLLIVLALLVLAMFAGVVWLAYTQGVARGRTETPVLTAQNGPARIAPQNPGGNAQPYKGFKIYEQPAPPDEDVDTTTMPAKPAPVAVEAPKPVAVEAPKLAMVAPAPPKPVVAAAPPPVAKPAPAPVASPKIAASVPAPAKSVPAPAKPAPVKSAPVQTASVAPAANAPPRSLTPPPAALKPAPVAPKPVAVAPAKPVAAAGGAYVLQIGAYKSQADADAAWKNYAAKHGALLSGASNDVQQADLGDKGTWYRLRITGFPSKDVASAMCDRLKADGGSCFLGK